MEGTKDRATVSDAGATLTKLIDGVGMRIATTQFDQRGELCEVYNPAWDFETAPLVYVYSATVRPNCIKGWVYHVKQTDRLFFQSGFAKLVLYDAREQSRTFGMVNELFLSERNRGLVAIPPYVLHAVQNVGSIDVVFINMPTIPYNHRDPDKIRVAASDVPYDFGRGMAR